MLRKFRKFGMMSSADKKLFLEAYLTLGIMRAAILTVPFKRLTRSLKHLQNKGELTLLNDKEIEIAIRVGQTITRAANHTPWESACLAQALAAQRMLQKRSIPGVFYLGVIKDERIKEKMTAHAWSQCGDAIITGARGHEAFTVISVFGWGKR